MLKSVFCSNFIKKFRSNPAIETSKLEIPWEHVAVNDFMRVETIGNGEVFFKKI